jgi:hypothetical protein
LLQFAQVCYHFYVQGLAPLVDIPELERSILGRGGNINYKHFFVKPGQPDGKCACEARMLCQGDHMPLTCRTYALLHSQPNASSRVAGCGLLAGAAQLRTPGDGSSSWLWLKNTQLRPCLTPLANHYFDMFEIMYNNALVWPRSGWQPQLCFSRSHRP